MSGSIILKKEIDAWLRKYGLYRKNIPPDETSLFRAVSDQIYLTQARHEKVRFECYEFTKTNYESVKCFIKTGDKLEVYLKKLLNHTITAGLQEIQVLSKRFERDFIIYNGLNFTIENVTNFGFENTIQVCQLDNIHFDSVMNEGIVEIAGFCQGILYKLLYKKVFKYENVDAVVQNMLYRHPDCYSESYKPKPEDLNLPFPYKVAKALDETQYRNIEYDCWTQFRRDFKMENWYFGDDDLKAGTKCLFQAKHRMELCFIQKLNENEGYIYNQDQGCFMSVKRSALKPMPDATPWPLPDRKTKRRNSRWRQKKRTSRPNGSNNRAISNASEQSDVNLSDTVSFTESFQTSCENRHTSTPNEMIAPSDNTADTNNDNESGSDTFLSNINESESFVTNNNDSDSFVTNRNESESFVTNNNDSFVTNRNESESFVTNNNDSFVTNRYESESTVTSNNNEDSELFDVNNVEFESFDDNNKFVYSNDSYDNNFVEYTPEQFFADMEQNHKMSAVSQYYYQIRYYNRVQMFRSQYIQGTCNMSSSCPCFNQYPSPGPPTCCSFDQSVQDNNYNYVQCDQSEIRVQQMYRMGPTPQPPQQFTQSQPYPPVCGCPLPQYYGPVSPPFGPVPGTPQRPLYPPRSPMDPPFPNAPQRQMYSPPFGPVPPTSQHAGMYSPPFCPVPTSQLGPLCPPPFSQRPMYSSAFCSVSTSPHGPIHPPPFCPVPTAPQRLMYPPACPCCPVPTASQGPMYPRFCPQPFGPVPTSPPVPMHPPTFGPVSTSPEYPMEPSSCPIYPVDDNVQY